MACGPALLDDGFGPVSTLCWRSHRLRRRVRSTLGAETMAMSEGTEAADVFRAYLAEGRCKDFSLRNWHMAVAQVAATSLTDCKSLFDHLHKQGSSPPDDRRLGLDMQILRDLMENGGLKVKWVSTTQMIADGLTKADRSSYLRYVLHRGVLHVVRHPAIEWVCTEERRRTNEQKKLYVLAHRKAKKIGKATPTA